MTARVARDRHRAHALVALALLALLLAPVLATAATAPSPAVSAAVSAPAEMVVTASTLNVRAAPGTGQAIIGTLTGGTVVTIGGEGVAADGHTWSSLASGGWVAEAYLAPAGSGAVASPAGGTGDRMVTTTEVNFRAGPGMGHGVIRVLGGGTVLTVTGAPVAADGHTWYPVRTSAAIGGETGWVFGGGIGMVDPEMPDPTVEYDAGSTVRVTSGPLRLRAAAGTGAAILADLPTGMTLTVTGLPVGAAGYTWYPVRCPAGDGWVASAYLAWGGGEATGGDAIAPAGHAVVDVPQLNLRAGPGTDHPVLTVLSGGTALTLGEGPTIAGGYSWYAVVTPGGVGGWVIGEALAR